MHAIRRYAAATLLAFALFAGLSQPATASGIGPATGTGGAEITQPGSPQAGNIERRPNRGGKYDAIDPEIREQYRRLRIFFRRLAAAARRQAQGGPTGGGGDHSALLWHWAGVAQCESGGNWSINTGNGYYGGLQFSLATWHAYGGQGMPNLQPAWYQATIADRVRTQSGLHHWPVCGRYYR